jgi:hemerythrin
MTRIAYSRNFWGMFMSFEWDDRYSVADDQINHQHKQLFRLVNQFLSANGKSELLKCADALFDYTQIHFAYEESLMLKCNFPEYAQHVIAHQQLIARLVAQRSHISGDSMDKLELENVMKHWALVHIAKADTKLAEYLIAGETKRSDLTQSSAL